ncbi:MAG: Ldh family oxidoreductase, partial [Thermoflexales bacterium]|nr:Ldh family oxidoreductase [Thermoflexales bacterium]
MRTNLHRPQGRPSTDPRAFYGLPHGAILPFGSQYGYKGFGLALLVDLLGGCRPASSAQTFKALVEDMRAYVVNTLPMKD